MDDGRPLARGLVKEYADVTAVDDLSFAVEPARVTRFLRRYADLEEPTLRRRDVV